MFEPNSYGFRPGRSAHDAIEAIFLSIKQKAKYVLDADIAGGFDHISHEALREKLQTFPAMRRYIKGGLKAGVMEGQPFSRGKHIPVLPTEEGTPQGGVISPLLANIALHGLEREIARGYNRHKVMVPQVIRYADDFVMLCADRKTLEAARERAVQWLKTIGLEMKPSKTRITPTLEQVDGNTGFDFARVSGEAGQEREIALGKRTSRRPAGIQDAHHTLPRGSKSAHQKAESDHQKGKGATSGGTDS